MMFEVGNGTFGYGTELIVENINLSLESGEVLSVLGSNGAGKTTLLRCMMGLLKWQSGETLIDGVDISKLPSKAIWKKIAYVPQARSVAFGYTALDMVLLGRSAHIEAFAQPTEQDMNIAEKAMETVGILHLAQKSCSCMSGGELQMVLIARALCSAPQMLVLDEPESNLDFRNQLIILETIRHLSHTCGISAIINTHYPDHALQIADKALLLNSDRSSCFGKACDVITEKNMQESFGVQVHIEEIVRDGICYKSVMPLRIA